MQTPIRIEYSPLEARQRFLIDANTRWLRQALAIVERIDDDTYKMSPQGSAPHRVGGHLRHVIEFYDCFLKGLDLFHVDYDSRARDLEIETSRAAALLKIREVIEALRSTRDLRGDGCMWIRVEDAGAQNVPEPFLLSSVGRELQVLSSHTIHHFALIGLTLKLHGVDVPPDFGMAPSTLSYLATRDAATAEAA